MLNTAARMEGKCNEYGKKVLASESLKKLLPGDQTLAFELMGNIPLRGKEQSVDIYSVEII